MSFRPGDRVGHYRLDQLIGAGGMGEVYLAHDELLARRVAVKIVTAASDTDPLQQQRLLHEARTIADLTHPAICQVFDAGTDDGRAWVVMEYVEGETLADCLAGGPLSPERACAVCAEVADALAAAHDRGVVHRDLKPLNIMITRAGKPKVLDFGIARLLPQHRLLAGDAPTRTSLTHGAAIVGTAAYMSPEQIQQKAIDGRSDLFALGAVLHECLTGRPAFFAPTAPEILAQVLHVDPPLPSSMRPGLDTRADGICRKLLAKDPGARYDTAQAAAAALRAAATGALPAEDQPSPAQRSRFRAPRVLAAAAALAIVAAGTIGVARWSRRADLTPPPEAAVWFAKGSDALREGGYYTAAKALEEGLRRFPQSPIGYAQLAEARAELDDQNGAADALLQLSQHFPDESVFPADDRLRVTATRDAVRRDLDGAIAAYRTLAARHGTDAAAFVDLGRAQAAAQRFDDARTSFERATAIDPQNPAADVQLASVQASTGDSAGSLASLARAERLYTTASNVEGRTEVLIRRALLLNRQGDIASARRTADEALTAARAVASPFHLVRAELASSSIAASEGHYSESERQASAAVAAAIDADLDVVAADGLVDLAMTLQLADRVDAARAALDKAVRLADKRGALRTRSRAQTQLGSLDQQVGDAQAALADVGPALAFFQAHQYAKLQVDALNIAARANQQLGRAAEARRLSMDALKIASDTGNDTQRADALGSLAVLVTANGSLPEALAYREQLEAIHRRQNDEGVLPYDLTNRAELLIHLGRLDEASAALDEVEAGIARGVDAYVGRKTRAIVLRALAAAVSGRFAAAAGLADSLHPDPQATDSASVLAPVLSAYAHARLRPDPRAPALPRRESLSGSLGRERQYWAARTCAANRQWAAALAEAEAELDGLAASDNDEIRWRVAAVGAAAAAVLRNGSDASRLRSVAAGALTRIRSRFGAGSSAYERRPDLAELRAAAGL